MQQGRPLLSVIMPVYNAGRYVAYAIDSILGQTFSDLELIVVDDASSDDSLVVVKGYDDRRIKVVRLSTNVGKAVACNSVLPQCTGKYITVHDADDISDRLRFEKQVAFLELHAEFAMCGTQFYEINDVGSIIRKVHLDTDPLVLKGLMREDSQFHGPTMVIRKDIIGSVGGLYRDFRNKEDVDLAMRIAEKYPVVNLDEYLYYYRLIPQGLSKVNFDFLRFEGLKVLHLLAEQRSREGVDCLMRGDLKQYEQLLQEIRRPYIEDPSLLYRKGLSLNVYFRFWSNAFYYSRKAILANPSKWINYRELLHLLRIMVSIYLFRRHE